MLWLDKHKPSLKVIPPEIQARLDAGNDFGALAMGMFGPYEEMTVYRPGTTIPDKKAMLAKTQDAMERGVEVICEAAFSNYNNYCAVDILRKTETGYDFYEVKNSPALSDQFIKDAGFQYYILARCKVKVGRVFIVIHGPDEENPFVPVCERMNHAYATDPTVFTFSSRADVREQRPTGAISHAEGVIDCGSSPGIGGTPTSDPRPRFS